MVVDEAPHLRDLAADQRAARPLAPARLVRQHRERRLEAMGEVADVGAGALDQRLAVVDQRVELGGERLELGREAALEPPGQAGADRRERRLDPPQGLERDAHLQQQRADQADEQDREREAQQPVEALALGLDLGAVAGDRVEQGGGGIGQADPAHQQPHRPAVGAGEIAGQRRRAGRQRHRQALVPQGRRAVEHLRAGVDLPVPARERLGEARLAELQAELQAAVLVDLAAGDQALEDHAEPAVEIARDGIAEQRREQIAAAAEHQRAPQGRARDQAKGERVAAPHRAPAQPPPSGARSR